MLQQETDACSKHSLARNICSAGTPFPWGLTKPLPSITSFFVTVETQTVLHSLTAPSPPGSLEIDLLLRVCLKDRLVYSKIKI